MFLSRIQPDYSELLLPGQLRRTTAWIRDILDPTVAREGPDALRADDVLAIHTLLLVLQTHHVSQYVLRFSRIHLAVTEICGRATRWPKKLVDESDRVMAHLEMKFGSLKHIKAPLFDLDGRLSGVCERSDITKAVSKLGMPSLLGCLLIFTSWIFILHVQLSNIDQFTLLGAICSLFCHQYRISRQPPRVSSR
jgi:hypothetical protein